MMDRMGTLAAWSGAIGAALGFFAIWGLRGFLSLILIGAAWWLIAEMRSHRAAAARALEAHEAVAARVEAMIEQRRRETQAHHR